MSGTGDVENQATPRRTVGGGATLTSLAAVGTAVAGGLLGVVVARLLGPADTGAYNIASTTLMIGMTFSALGVNVGGTYLVSAKRWAAGDALRQAQVAAALAGMAAFIVGAAVLALGRETLFAGVPVGVVLLALAGIPFGLSWLHASSVALALDRYETFATAPLGANVAALALALALTPLFGLAGAVAALAGAHVANSARLLLRCRRELPRAEPRWLTRTAGELRAAVSFGFKSYLPQALQLLNYRADLFVLNAFAAAATVGQYAVALLVTELGFLLPRSLAAVVMPRVAALDASPEGDQQEMVIVKSMRHTVLLALPSALVLALGVLAIPIVFGPDFSEAIAPGLILVPGVVLLGLAGVMMAAVVGRGRPEYALYGALMVTPPTMALYVLLIPELEEIGAALASTSSYALGTAISLHWFRRATRISSLAVLLPTREDLADYRALFERGRDYARRRRR